jgi:hypothetical protein
VLACIVLPDFDELGMGGPLDSTNLWMNSPAALDSLLPDQS